MLYQLDLRELMPPAAAAVLQAAAFEHGRAVVKKGRGPGSLEPEETAGLDYRVMTGVDVREHLSWLYDLYVGPIRTLVEATLGQMVIMPDDMDGDINVNLLQGRGARYEWHTDRQRWTLNLFAVTLRPEDGGALIVKTGPEIDKKYIYPRFGYAILFDGHKVPHAVEELKDDLVRVTVPMTYFTEPAAYVPGLNNYLFSEQ